MQRDLDHLFLQGKLSDDEYVALAIDEGQVVAIAIDEMDRITTVSLFITPKGYCGEVLYPPDIKKNDEKFLIRESSFDKAKASFKKRIANLESTGKHKFDTTWFAK